MTPFRLSGFLKFVATCVLLLCIASPAALAGKKGGGGGKGRSAGADSPNVTSVSAESITMGSQTYTVTKFTEVYVNGQKATIGDVQTGMEGSISPAMDGVSARLIQVQASNDKVAEAAKKPKKGGKKKK